MLGPMRAIWLSAARRPAAAKFTESVTAAIPKPLARTMSADRSRNRRTTRSASRAMQRKLQSMSASGAQSGDRIHAGGAPSGIKAEHKSDAGRKTESVGEYSPIGKKRGSCPSSACSNDDLADERAKRATSETDEGGFDGELPEDVKATGADSAAHSDLLPALGDSDQHQTHDDNSAEENRGERNPFQGCGERGFHLSHLRGHGARVGDGKVVEGSCGEVVPGSKQSSNRLNGGIRAACILNLDDHHGHVVAIEKTLRCGLDRNENQIIETAACR